jgi:hypothetical protein
MIQFEFINHEQIFSKLTFILILQYCSRVYGWSEFVPNQKSTNINLSKKILIGFF